MACTSPLWNGTKRQWLLFILTSMSGRLTTLAEAPDSPTCLNTWHSKAPSRSAPKIGRPSTSKWCRLEQDYDAYQAEKNKGLHADQAIVKKLWDRVKVDIDLAQKYVVPNLYPQIIERNGGTGLNA